jgi:hypothetical protein
LDNLALSASKPWMSPGLIFWRKSSICLYSPLMPPPLELRIS